MDCDEEVKQDADEIEAQFLTQFSCMNTNEKDELVVSFQNICSNTHDLTYTTARFFLDMNNWNLQAAVGCYFDFLATNQNANVPMPSMRVVRELTVGLGESVTRNTQFQQSWLLENNGEVPWPEDCYLKLVSELNDDGKMPVQSIQPNDTTIVTINLCSPNELGQFRTQFCLCTAAGQTFGPIIWAVVDVSDSGTLALTQQLSQLHTSASSNHTITSNQAIISSFPANCVDGLTSVANNHSFLSNPGQTSSSIPFNNSLVQNPAPQNSPVLDDEMMVEKINTNNI